MRQGMDGHKNISVNLTLIFKAVAVSEDAAIDPAEVEAAVGHGELEEIEPDDGLPNVYPF